MKAPSHKRSGSPIEEMKEDYIVAHGVFSQKEEPISFSNSNGVKDQHSKNASNFSGMSQHSYMSSINHGENIYDSKINEERPKINKSLGKHQINNNLHMWTKMGAKIYKDV